MSERQDYDIAQILERMRADYWRNLEEVEAVEAGERGDYLVITLGSQRFGLPATLCKEVLKLPRIVRVPRLPAHLAGIINLRGEIVAVTDLRPLLQLPAGAATEGSRLVVVAGAGLKTALLAESVVGLTTVAAAAVQSLVEGVDDSALGLFSGKVEDADGALLLFDGGRLLARPEMIVDCKGTERQARD